jgi:hypothetical protein
MTKISARLIPVFLILLLLFTNILAGTKSKTHGHQGVLEPFTGKAISSQITAEQSAKLDKGDPVTYKERIGKSGRGALFPMFLANLNVIPADFHPFFASAL